MARRVLLSACLVLAVPQLLGPHGGQVAAQDSALDKDANVDLDELSETLESSNAIKETAETVGDTASTAAGELAAKRKKASSDKSSGSRGSFFSSEGLKKPKTGNNMCSWSWKERRCEPEALCQYKYQFLDATVSESCRLKDFSTVREVFKTSDVEVKPAVALAGAAGLFAADLLAIRYTNWLPRFPLLFNVVQGFILFVSGDTLFQVLEQGWETKVGLRLWRMVRSGVIGALNNGLVHYSYYKWIDKRFPYDKFSEKRFGPADGTRSKLAVGFAKWATEWPTIGAYKIASMYILTAVMTGSTEGLAERMKDGFFLTWLRSLQVWPIYDTILYAYVPTAHRPLFNSFMSIAWGGYLSHVSQPHDDDGDDAEPFEIS